MITFDYSIPFYVKQPHEAHIDLLCEAFYQNPRLRSLVNQQSEIKIKKGIRNIIAFAYERANRVGGVFTSINEDAILLYYRNNALKLTTADLATKIKLILLTLPPQNVYRAISNEKKIKAVRENAARSFGDADFLYVWFMAQRQAKKGLSDLIELKEHIFNVARQQQLPLYMETTVERMVPIYKRLGFSVYHTVQLPGGENTVWFFRFN